MSPTTDASLRKDHAEEATATTLDLADEVEAAMRDILHFTRQRISQLRSRVLARGQELERVIRRGGR